jgi:hypothetical protein
MTTKQWALAGVILIGSLGLVMPAAQAQTFASLTDASVAGERDCVSPNQSRCEMKALRQFNNDLEAAGRHYETRLDKAFRQYKRDLKKPITKQEAKEAYIDGRQKAKALYKKEEDKALKKYAKAMD